jgi:hypothetical protein
MSATPKGIKGPPKLIRILMLPLLLILLLLLVAYAALPYLPLRTPPPVAGVTPEAAPTELPAPAADTATPTEPPAPTNTRVVAATPTTAETEAPQPVASPTEMPSPTYTPVLVKKVTPTETAAPVAAVSPTATPVPPTDTPAPAPTATPTEVATVEPSDMEALEATTEPLVPSPTATATRQGVAAPPTATAPSVAPPPTPLPPPSATVIPPTPPPPPAAALSVVTVELLQNGAFTLGYQDNGVATGWHNFSNAGAEFSYRADDWPPVTGVPGTGQTMRIRNADLPDRYVGIYQTVTVIPDRVYTFTVAGLVRTNVGDVLHTDFGYRMEVGFDTLGGRNWKRVPEWFELPWDEQRRAQDSYRIDAFTTTVEAETEKLTVFVRAWKKWADAGEGAYDVTHASLVGPAYVGAGGVQALGMPVTGQGEVTVWQQVRIAVTLLLLAVLVGGALWRLRPWQVR